VVATIQRALADNHQKQPRTAQDFPTAAAKRRPFPPHEGEGGGGES
jgi:hypothetical protein